MSRAESRQHLASLLETALRGASPLVAAVYPAQVADFQQQSPIVTVSSGGSLRERLTFNGSDAGDDLIVDIFVLYSDAASGWSETDAEDQLDTIREAIGGVVDANQRTAYWQAIDESGRSTTDFLVIGGQEYKHERIPLRTSTF